MKLGFGSFRKAGIDAGKTFFGTLVATSVIGGHLDVTNLEYSVGAAALLAGYTFFTTADQQTPAPPTAP